MYDGFNITLIHTLPLKPFDFIVEISLVGTTLMPRLLHIFLILHDTTNIMVKLGGVDLYFNNSLQ